jgi:hypothetical protein
MLKHFIEKHTSNLVDINKDKFESPKQHILTLVLFIAYNVLIQGIADVVLKVLTFFPGFPPLPLQIDFLFLTAVSVLMGYQALVGMRRREIDVTRNSFAIGILVEAGLVISDITNVVAFSQQYNYLLWVRLPFIVLTVINFFALLYVARRLHIFRDDGDHFRLV